MRRGLAALGVVLAGALPTACSIDVDLGAWRPGLDGPDVVEPPPPPPCLELSPHLVDFGRVARDVVADQAVRITNRCDVPVAWFGLKLGGDSGFTVTVAGETLSPSPSLASDGVSWAEPLVIAPGGWLTLFVSYQPTAPGWDAANVVILTDDPGQPTGHALRLQAGGAWPCVAVRPKSLDFGGQVVGEGATRTLEVASCGAAPLRVAEVSLAAGAGAFELVGGQGARTVPPGGGFEIDVRYRPVSVSPGWPEAPPVWDVGALRLAADTFEGIHDFDLRGFGVTEACPQAVITRLDGDGPVAAGATVRLSAVESVGVDGPIARWSWEVEGPFAQVSPLSPAPDAQEVSFRASVAGDYRFTLTVWDGADRPACTPAEEVVVAEAGPGLRVELMWVTPNDPDPFDEGAGRGADLDVHLLHPFAVGADLDGDGAGDGFFDLPYDAFFANPEPAWDAGLGTPHAAWLVEDDVDGTGPEVVVVEEVPGEASYRIGVHAWDDHGFGASWAVVRVIVDDEVVWTSEAMALLRDDLWEAARVTWPGPVVTPIVDAQGEPRVFHGAREAAGATKPWGL